MPPEPRKTEPFHDPDGGFYQHTKRRRRRLWRLVALTTLFVLMTALCGVLYLVRTAPAFWIARNVKALAMTRDQRVAQAVAVEDRLLALFGRGSAGAGGGVGENAPPGGGAAVEATLAAQFEESDEPKMITLTCDEANAWLDERLRDWMKQRDYDMPPQINKPMIAVQKGRLIFAFEYESESVSQVFSAACSPEIKPDGMMRLNVDDVQAGRMPVPTSTLGASLRNAAPSDSRAAKAGEWLDKLNEVEIKPVAKLAPGLKVRVIGYRVLNEGVELTLKRETPRAAPVIAEVPTE
jgi:hypothetical protein